MVRSVHGHESRQGCLKAFARSADTRSWGQPSRRPSACWRPHDVPRRPHWPNLSQFMIRDFSFAIKNLISVGCRTHGILSRFEHDRSASRITAAGQVHSSCGGAIRLTTSSARALRCPSARLSRVTSPPSVRRLNGFVPGSRWQSHRSDRFSRAILNSLFAFASCIPWHIRQGNSRLHRASGFAPCPGLA
jgi:hypothetical protein